MTSIDTINLHWELKLMSVCSSVSLFDILGAIYKQLRLNKVYGLGRSGSEIGIVSMALSNENNVDTLLKCKSACISVGTWRCWNIVTMKFWMLINLFICKMWNGYSIIDYKPPEIKGTEKITWKFFLAQNTDFMCILLAIARILRFILFLSVIHPILPPVKI